MPLPKGYHVQMTVTDGAGNIVNMLPIAIANDVKIDLTNESLPSGLTNLQDLIDAIGELAFKDAFPVASTTEAGIVQLSDTIDDTESHDVAATTAAVSAVNQSAVKKTGDETVAGVKSFTDGIDVGNANLKSVTDGEGNTTLTVSFK